METGPYYQSLPHHGVWTTLIDKLLGHLKGLRGSIMHQKNTEENTIESPRARVDERRHSDTCEEKLVAFCSIEVVP